MFRALTKHNKGVTISGGRVFFGADVMSNEKNKKFSLLAQKLNYFLASLPTINKQVNIGQTYLFN